MKGRRNEWVHLSSVDKVALRIVCSSSFVRDVAARHRVDGGAISPRCGLRRGCILGGARILVYVFCACGSLVKQGL